MLFVSYQFIFFLVAVLILFYCLPGRFQTVLLLSASLLFYWYADKSCLLYILTTVVITFFSAKKIFKHGKTAHKKNSVQKCWLTVAICLNAGLLIVFKYSNFAVYNINSLFDFFHGTRPLNYLSIVLPLGISFYTFQSIGYLVDVYRGKCTADKNLLHVALFLCFFPQLIQGPISRFDELAPNLFKEKKFDKNRICAGLQRILWGYFKKLVVADRILVAVNEIIRNPEQYQGTYVLLGALFYAVELYADFTGGIDITIGVGELFGIKIAENFRQPFFSKNVKEYWTRWHISMGTWFRDYIFYPVSICGWMKKLTSFVKRTFGKKTGRKFPVYLSSLFVWFLTGVWHGASWNFVAWGLGNFLLIILSEECQPMFYKIHKRFPKLKQKKWFSVFQITRTILLMSMLRMFDCYTSVTETVRMFGSIFMKWNGSILFDGSLLRLGLKITDYCVILVGIILMFTVSICQKNGSVRLQIRKQKAGIRFCIWYGLFLAILLLGAYGAGYDATQFIYNQY